MLVLSCRPEVESDWINVGEVLIKVALHETGIGFRVTVDGVVHHVRRKESIHLDMGAVIQVLEYRGNLNAIRVGIDAPRDVIIKREKLIRRERRQERRRFT